MERWDLCKGLSVLDVGFEEDFLCQDICCPYGFSSVRTFTCTENADRSCQFECTIDSVTGEFAVKEVCNSRLWKGSNPTKPWSKIVEAVNARLTLMDKGFTLDATKMDGFEMFGLSHPTIVKFLADTKKVAVEEKPPEENLDKEPAEARADADEQNEHLGAKDTFMDDGNKEANRDEH